MGHMKKLVGLCVGLMMIVGSVAVATPAQAGETKVIKFKSQEALSARILISITRI